jgi:hypothetical protein
MNCSTSKALTGESLGFSGKVRVQPGDLLLWQNTQRRKRRKAAAALPVGGRVSDADLSAFRCDDDLSHASTRLSEPEGPLDGRSIKLAFQRWYSMYDKPFFAERPVWRSHFETRKPHQPVVGCDPVGLARTGKVSTVPEDQSTIGCRLYNHWPYGEK